MVTPFSDTHPPTRTDLHTPQGTTNEIGTRTIQACKLVCIHKAAKRPRGLYVLGPLPFSACKKDGFSPEAMPVYFLSFFTLLKSMNASRTLRR